MKKSYKVVWSNMAIALLASILFSLTMQEWFVFVLTLGSVSLILGGINLFVGLILLAAKNNEWGQACLIGGGIVMLIGAGICGPMLFAGSIG